MPDPNDFNHHNIEEFRANGGKLGGYFTNAPILLLHTTGAVTGRERVNPMMYLKEDERIYVFASKAGADTNPDWYTNLVAHPEVDIEMGSETFHAVATVVTGEERDRVYHTQEVAYPQFAEYQKKTTRIIPVVELTRQ